MKMKTCIFFKKKFFFIIFFFSISFFFFRKLKKNIHFGLPPPLFRIYFPSRISEQTREIYTKK
ncbi:hypothetical protein LbFV_ORF25 [Leptopilina boulardi filamentous virus]|uniref:Uncharacterized protein n=1 Tax=Leptopilina boulardi filamentous virus TaxID=552509 RepID=A0A1S5YD75_9VIRU|nr:hypothetical protein LbFV_ORF25 [Leptopilina boulardi filamentous virus]AQQ79945.1 hypothetical protein LbFV_ORF25 [Leptopilina boulardi filamentous virus]